MGKEKNNAHSPDIHFMKYAISLASRGVGTTFPNPSVGCVIVKNNQVIGAAHTAIGGRPHAETQALLQAGSAANGAIAYVTLEPCAHHGQTPPCAEALIKSGIKKVVVAAIDPFSRVDGKGIAMLESAGIEVVTGICEFEATKINEGFFSVQQKGRPFITLKTATSLDGKIALKNGESKWITGEESRSYVHLIRARNDALITGIATVMADDPAFTCRLPGMEDKSPIRVVLDTNLSLPTNSQLVKTAHDVPCWVMTIEDTISAQSAKAKALEEAGVRLIAVNKASNGKVCMEDAVHKLAKNGITTAMIEAGASINTAALRLNLVDRLAWFRAPLVIGNDGLPAFLDMDMKSLATSRRFSKVEHKVFGADTLEMFDFS